MNIKAKKLFLFFFLLTRFINNSDANSITYLADTIKHNNNKEESFKNKIEKFAKDSIKINIVNQKAYLFGEAKIIYEDITITAAYIEINWKKNTVYASTSTDTLGNKIGHPIFTEKDESFKAHSITYNFKTKKAYVKQISKKEGEGFILGKTIKKEEDEIFYLEKGDYTTCDKEHPHYSIRANKIKIIGNEKIITGPAYLTFFNIPTPILFPFGYFPNNQKKSSGIIIPSYGESAGLGFFLKQGGYYFTINDKMDLSIKSDIYSKGSWSLFSNLRYKRKYKYNGSLDLSYGNIINSMKGFPDYSIKRDFFIRWRHQQDLKANPSLQFSTNINAGSSTFHKNNSFNANDYLTNTFQSSVNINKRWIGTPFNLSANLRHNQNTQTKIINLSIPEITFNMNRVFPFKNIGKSIKKNWYHKIGVSYNMNTKNSISIADSILFTKEAFNNFRYGMKHNIPISTSVKILKHFTLAPRINITERWYLSQIEKNWNGNSIITDTINKFTRAHDYSFSASINTKIYGMIQMSKGKIETIRHVITPNISFNYRPDFGNEKYGYYKSVQSDTLGNIQEYSIMNNGIFGSPAKGRNGIIGFNLGNILEMKIKSKKDTTEEIKKIKILESLNISSSYNIFKDSLNLSTININARTRLLNIFDITFSSQYDPYTTNKEQTQNINQLEINTNNRIARLKSINSTIGINLNNKTINQKKSKKEDDDEDFYEIPWDLRANYSITYDKGYRSAEFADTTQNLNFSGNIKLTPKWKIGFRSGYDFDTKELTYTSVDIYRDLHCWEMLFNWIPMGLHRSYMLTIRVKSSILKDLKFEKRKDWLSPDYN